MATIYRSILEVDDAAGVADACETEFRAWVTGKDRSKSGEVPALPADGELHPLGDGMEVKMLQMEAEPGRIFRGELRESSEDQQIHTTATCLESGGQKWLWVDIDRLAEDAWGFSWVPYAPRIVRTLQARWTCRRANDGLEDHHHVLGKDQGTRLAHQILDEQREVPFVVVSPSGDELSNGLEPAITRAEQLHRHLAGIAPVYVLGNGAVSAFSKAIGGDSSSMDVHSGAIRSYLPGVGSDSDSAWRHRLVSKHRLGRNPAAVARRQLAMPLIRASTNQTPPDAWELFRKLPEFSPGGVRDDDYIKLAEVAEQEADQLQRDLAAAREQIEELETWRDLEREELASVLSRSEDLERRLRFAHSQLRQRGEEPEEPEEERFDPESCAEVVEHVEGQFDLLSIGPDVDEEAGKLDEHAVKAWAVKAFQSFRALQSYAEKKRDGWNGDFRTYCFDADGAISLGWIAMKESETTDQNPKFRRLRTFPVDVDVDEGGEVYMPAHIKIDQGGNPAPRIHFHDDTGGATGKVHIGWFGAHLDNKSKN